KSSEKSEVPLRSGRPYTPPILRTASLTSAAPASRICSALITVAPIGAKTGLLGKRDALTITGDSSCCAGGEVFCACALNAADMRDASVSTRNVPHGVLLNFLSMMNNVELVS